MVHPNIQTLTTLGDYNTAGLVSEHTALCTTSHLCKVHYSCNLHFCKLRRIRKLRELTVMSYLLEIIMMVLIGMPWHGNIAHNYLVICIHVFIVFNLICYAHCNELKHL